MNRLIERAKREAMKSDGVGSNSNYRVGCVLSNRSRVILAKHNSYKTHPALLRFTPFPYLHAEAACILCHGLDNCTNLSLYVARIRHPNDTLTMAKPCRICQELIKEAKISQVVYTDWKGEIQCLPL